MSAGRAGALFLAATALLSGCGTTLVEVDDPVRPTASSVPSADAASADDSTAELLAAIENDLRGLDQEIIDDEAAASSTLDRIESAWFIVASRLDDDTALFNFGQAIELARSGVERRRPADASKGLKIFAEVADAVLER